MLAHLHAYIHKNLRIVELSLSLAHSIVSFSLLLALSLAPYRFPSLSLFLSHTHTHKNRIMVWPIQLYSTAKTAFLAKAKSDRVSKVSMRCGAVSMG